jgi:hypothetical protein
MRLLRVAVCVMIIGATARAEPRISSYAPGAIAPGKGTEIVLKGEKLDWVREVWTSFEAKASVVRSEQAGNKAVVRFELPKEVPCGVGAFRVASSNGVSALQLLMIDDLGTVNESGSNSTMAAAQKISPPVAVDGVCKESGFDSFRFAAKRGESLTIETVAQRLGALADTVVRILDEQGKEIAFCDDGGAGRDSRFIFRAPSTGEYFLELRDMNYGGGEEYRYRLRIGEFPLITTVFPPVIRWGKAQTVEWLGPEAHGRAAARVEPRPRGTQAWGMVSVRRKGQSGFATVLGSELAEVVESEPNDKIEQANSIESGAVSGRFEKDGDRDYFSFEVKKDERLVFEAATRSFNSPCDALVRILRADGSRLVESAEGVFTNTFKEGGTYFAEVQELTGKGAIDFVYRLEIKRLEPGFELTTESDHFEMKDGSLTLKVTCVRRDYAGPITLRANEDWFMAQDNVIAEKKNETVLKLKPTEGCPRDTILVLGVSGTACIGEREVNEILSTAPAMRKLWPRMTVLPGGLDGVVGAWVGR